MHLYFCSSGIPPRCFTWLEVVRGLALVLSARVSRLLTFDLYLSVQDLYLAFTSCAPFSGVSQVGVRTSETEGLRS